MLEKFSTKRKRGLVILLLIVNIAYFAQRKKILNVGSQNIT